MADLYNNRAPSPATEPEEISTFLHHLLNNNPSSSSPPPPPQPETASAAEMLDPHRFGLSEPEECRAGGGGGSSVNFSDPGGYFAKENVENAVSSFSSKWRGVSVENDAGDFSCDSENGAEASEVPSDRVRRRSSSKRSRTAEFHNLSEKRRRSRINEKMKALQNLIPNSNKTDKASMLDDAIEYLKQLQLQVQMLTMRNGLNLNPMCFAGVVQPLQPPLSGLNFDEGNILLNANAATGAFSANEESSVHTSHNLPSQCIISTQPIVIPSRTNINSPDTSFGFDSLVQVHHGPLSLFAASKETCGEGTPQRQLGMNQTVKTSLSSMP